MNSGGCSNLVLRQQEQRIEKHHIERSHNETLPIEVDTQVTG